jgi:hypothetical protein
MGFSQSWLAVKGKPRAAVLDELQLQSTGNREEIAESPIVGAELPGGWFLIVTDQAAHPFIGKTVLERLSAGCEIVTGYVEEHVMVSAATGWRNGRRIWSVAHDCQRDKQHLEALGELPVMFGGIRDSLYSEQRTVDEHRADVDLIFDVPLALAESLTGYRHDMDIPGGGDEPFEVLVHTSVNRLARGGEPSFWKRLFRA